MAQPSGNRDSLTVAVSSLTYAFASSLVCLPWLRAQTGVKELYVLTLPVTATNDVIGLRVSH